MTAFYVRIGAWSSDLCSSELSGAPVRVYIHKLDAARVDRRLGASGDDLHAVDLGEHVVPVTGDQIDDVLLQRRLRGQACGASDRRFGPVGISPAQIGK